MIRKVISILSVLMLLLFFSCASSQPDTETSIPEEPVVDTSVVESQENTVPEQKDNSSIKEDSTETTDNTEDTDNTESAENTVTPTEDITDSETTENTDSTDDTNNDTNTTVSIDSTDTETVDSSEPEKSELEESETESEKSEPEEPETESEKSELEEPETESDENEEDAFSDFEEPEDFEEPLVRDLIIPDSDNTENEDSTENENLEENDEYNEDEDSEPAESIESENDELIEETEPEVIIIPSRSVTLRKGENLVIVYPGSGWIYMGSLSEYNNMASKGRKLGSQDTKYTLLAKEAGTQIHHFYKVDNLTGEYIDDYIEITVLDKKGSSKTTITAPAYVEVVPQKPETPAKESKTISEPKSENEPAEDTNQTKQSEKSEESSAQTKPKQTTPVQPVEEKSSDEPDIPMLLDETNSEDEVINIEEDDAFAVHEQQPQINTDEILEKAKAAFDEKQYEESFNLLTEFFEYAIDRQDEALYLQGQLLESDSSIKDIKGAVQAYELLTKNYPSSIYWNDANKRIKYLKRFYYLSN